MFSILVKTKADENDRYFSTKPTWDFVPLSKNCCSGGIQTANIKIYWTCIKKHTSFFMRLACSYQVNQIRSYEVKTNL